MYLNFNKKITVLIPDGESPRLLSVINCLSLVENVEVYVMSSRRHYYMKYSRYIKSYVFYPDSNDRDWVNNINYEVEKNDIDVIMPVFEVGFNRIIKNKNKLKEKDKLCSLPTFPNFESARNKDSLYRHLKANDLPCPQSVILEPNKPIELAELTFPVVAKPVEGFGAGQGIEVLSENKDIFEYIKSNTFSCNTIFQNFIEGYDICCNVLCKNGDIIAYSIQKAHFSVKGKLTPQLSFSFVEEEALLQIIKKLMKSLNWSGVANIDCRYDIDISTFKIIEINTRFWENIEASAMAGVNFPYLYCLSTLNHNFKIQKADKITYLNLKGLIKRLKTNPFFIINTSYIWKNTPISFALRDPMPMLYKFVWRTKNILIQKIFRK